MLYCRLGVEGHGDAKERKVRCVYTLCLHGLGSWLRYGQKHEIAIPPPPREQLLGATSAEDEYVTCGRRAFPARTGRRLPRAPAGVPLRRPARRPNTAANVLAYLMCWLSQSKPSLKPRFSKTEHLGEGES